MKKLFLLLTPALLLLTSPARAAVLTPFIAYTTDIVGDVSTNPVTIESWTQTNSIIGVSTNLVLNFHKTYYPTNPAGFFSGYLQPGNYRLTVEGISRGVTFGMVSSSSTQNLAQLANIPVPLFMNFTLAQFSDAGNLAYSNAAGHLTWLFNQPGGTLTIGTLSGVTNGVLQRIAISNAIYFVGNFGNVSNGVWYSGTFSNGYLGNLTNGLLVNTVLLNPDLTNGVNYGNAFSSPGSGANSEQFGKSADASGENGLAVGYLALASAESGTAIGINAQATTGIGATALGNDTTAAAEGATALGAGAAANALKGTAVGWGATVDASHENSTAIGYGATTTRANQTIIGGGSVDVDIAGNLTVLGRQTNANFVGTNTFSELALPYSTYSSLAAGYNTVTTGTNTAVILTGNSGDPSLNGLNAQPNRHGAIRRFLYTGAFPLTVAHESGLESTAANRIRTPTGADMVFSGAAVALEFAYEAGAARWYLIAPLPSANSSPSVTMTNFVEAYFYTNNSGRTIHVQADAWRTDGAASGRASLELRIGDGATMNRLTGHGASTTASSIVNSYTNGVAAFITNGGVYCFTNNSSGAGNAAGLVTGTGNVTTF